MPIERDLPDDVRNEKAQKETETPSFASREETVTRVSDTSTANRSMSDIFKESYNRMHQDIYADLYKPPVPGTLPDWMRGKSNLPDWMQNPNLYPIKIDLKPGADPKKPDVDPKKPDAEPKKADADPKKPDADTKKPDPKDDFKPGAPDTNKPAQAENKENKPDKPAEPAPPPREKEQAPKPETNTEGKVSRDGNRVHVDYPGGQKTRDIVLDGQGKAQEIVTKDGTGTMHLVRKDDRWYARIQGMELQMPGKIEANDRGEVTFEMEQGIFRREKGDGTTVQEKTNTDGSRMSFYQNNQVEKLTRKDGSSIQVSQDGKTMLETLPNSNRTITWNKKDDGAWQSDGQPAQTRKNFKVEANGTTSWDGPEGLKFVVRGDGAMMVQGEGQAKITLDDQNRIKTIDYGKKTREFEYFDNSSDIKKTTIKDTEKGSTNTFTRDSASSNQWKVDNGQVWTGDIKVGPGGVYSYKPSGNAITDADKDGKWYTMWPDGKVTRDTIGDDGSRLSYENGKLAKALAKDGTSADITDSKITINNLRTGERTSWTKEGDSWKCDSPRFPGAKKDVSINEKCEVSFTAEDGSRHFARPDGKEVITRKDGVQLELNEQQQIDRIRKGDSVRSIERDSSGQISRVSDNTKGTERTVVERKPGDSISSIELSKDGDLLIKQTDKSSTLERANFTSVSRDKDGSPVQVTNQRGDTRTFKYSGDGPTKQLTEIQETKKTAKGDLTETWTRKPGTDDFASIAKNGKEKVHPGVKLAADGSGDYTYKTKEGKDVVARLGSDGGGDSALSESVEEARENLLDEMRDKLPEANFKRMQEMMQNFEKRMGDRAYLRKLAGVKGADAIDDEVQKDVQGTYDNLRQMVSQGDGDTFFDQKTRVKLAENFMFHAMEPTTIDQGPASNDDSNGHGTCWISSGQIWGMTQHPGAMADYLKQVSLKGQFTSKNSGQGDATQKTYTFSPQLLSFNGNKQESKWTIETATQQWRDEPGMRRQIDGDRSPVSKIFDYTLPVLSGSRREFDVDGGLFETANLVGQGHTRGTQDILYMVTGDAPCDKGEAGYSPGHLLDNNFNKSMAEKGTVLNYAPGHLRSMTVRKVDDKWYLLQDDQHGELEDKVLAQITDIERWAKGDKSVERPVNISAMELLHKKKYVGSGDSDAIGNVTPRRPASTPSDSNPAPNPRPRQVRYNNGYYSLPPVEIYR
jgi:hypothetical protein